MDTNFIKDALDYYNIKKGLLSYNMDLLKEEVQFIDKTLEQVRKTIEDYEKYKLSYRVLWAYRDLILYTIGVKYVNQEK